MSEEVKPSTYIRAVAEAWASIDGKLPQFRLGEADGADENGTYEGYLTEAAELAARLRMRGFKIVPLEPGE